MAQKAILNVSNYSGGLNNETNPRDLEVNQFQDIDSLSIETPGKLTVMGSTAEEGTTLTISGSNPTLNQGNGLFYFKSDKDPEQTNNTTDNTEMILVNDTADHEIKIYDKTDGAYSAKTIDYGPAASNVEFTAIDGNVRVTATDLNSDTITPQVFTFIDEKFDYGNTFAGTNFPRVDKTGWYTDKAIVDMPTTAELVVNNDSTITQSVDSGETVTSGLDNTTAAITFASSDGTKFTPGGYIQIGTPNVSATSEIFYISSISTNNITIATGGRGRYGSTIVAHANGAKIYYYNKTDNGEILRLPYATGVHSNNYGPLYVNFYLGENNTDTNLMVTETGEWITTATQKINLFSSFEYLDGQESAMKFEKTIGSTQLAIPKISMFFQIFGHIPNKTRLKSMKIWYNLTEEGFANIYSDATSKASIIKEPKNLLLEIDLRKGVRVPGADSYDLFNHLDTPSTVAQKKYVYPFSSIANQGSNDPAFYWFGYSGSGDKFYKIPPIELATDLDPFILGDTGTGYKTATVLNRTLYVGNVKYKDPITGEYVKKNDTVFKSNVNAFDSFVYDNRIDVEINDGDDIIKLESMGGRLFQFKKNTLYIVNVSRGVEFLEATLEYRGVERDYHVCKGEGFVAWFNKNGVFLFDGQQVRELLLDDKAQKRLKNWGTDYYHVDNIIGYISEEKTLVIANKNQKVLLYDLKSGAWSFGSKRFTTNAHTNMINLDNGKLVWMEKLADNSLKLRYFNPVPYKLLNTTAINEVALKTKDFTFKNPSVDKKIISVYINYKNGDGITLYGFTDGAEEILARLDGTNETSFKTLRINIRNARTEFENEDAFNSIKNFGLRLAGTDVATNFEINDMQIIFREKSVK